MNHSVTWRLVVWFWTVILMFPFLLAIIAPTAMSHPAADWYPREWFNASLPTIEWRFTAEVPSGNFRDRVEDAAQDWNQVGAGLTWVKNVPQYNNYAPRPPDCSDIPDGKNGIHFRDVNAYAAAATCYNLSIGRIKHVQIIFDEDREWNGSTSDPKEWEVDVWGIGAQEFGHATGFSPHFVMNEECPFHGGEGPYGDWNTMCDSVDILEPGDVTMYGKKYGRNLLVHDKHTFDAQY